MVNITAENTHFDVKRNTIVKAEAFHNCPGAPWERPENSLFRLEISKSSRI